MKRVQVRFVLKKGRGRRPSGGRHLMPDALSYIVFSNNVPMGVARAQYRLWKDKGADRFCYRMESAAFFSPNQEVENDEEDDMKPNEEIMRICQIMNTAPMFIADPLMGTINPSWVEKLMKRRNQFDDDLSIEENVRKVYGEEVAEMMDRNI